MAVLLSVNPNPYEKSESGAAWFLRRATRPAQKIPDNVDEILHRATLRHAFPIRNFHIPAALRINTDKTQVTLQEGGNIT